MSARDRILGRLRAAPQIESMLHPNVAGWFASHLHNEDPAQRIIRLRSALEASHAEVHDTTTTDWPALLLRIAAAKNLQTMLIGDDTTHGKQLATCPAERLQLIKYTQPIDSWRDTLFNNIDASLTLAQSAIADTGCLILWPDANEPRLMSLVPPVHFVLLNAAAIHATLYEAMVAENWKDGLPTNALLISGPSKTADIQQTLAYGAHGPKELIVLLVHAQEGAA